MRVSQLAAGALVLIGFKSGDKISPDPREIIGNVTVIQHEDYNNGLLDTPELK